jgi:hypothetical protein
MPGMCKDEGLIQDKDRTVWEDAAVCTIMGELLVYPKHGADIQEFQERVALNPVQQSCLEK